MKAAQAETHVLDSIPSPLDSAPSRSGDSSDPISEGWLFMSRCGGGAAALSRLRMPTPHVTLTIHAEWFIDDKEVR